MEDFRLASITAGVGRLRQDHVAFTLLLLPQPTPREHLQRLRMDKKQ
jgi:hypothetical protein